MGIEHDGHAEPFQHTLELSRAKDGSDPYAFRSGPQSYQRREKGSGIQEAELAWDAAMLEDLRAVQRTPRDPEAAARLGRLLGEFLRQTRWSERELVQALDTKRPIRLTIRSAAAELYALPWELLSLDASGSRLGRLRHCLLHYEWPKTKTTPPAAAQPVEGGRILFAWSAAALRVITARIGDPERTDKSWSALAEVSGFEQTWSQRVYGVDWPQAAELAA